MLKKCVRRAILVFPALLIGSAVVPLEVAAQVPSLISSEVSGCDFASGQINADCVISFIQYLIQLIFSLLGAFFLLMIVIGGYRIAIGSAIGDKESGKKQIFSAIIGFMIAAFSFFIISFVIKGFAGT
ncbi:MAG: hypothetical protein PHH13_03245 [Candidatus Peribacteraceae bacterium]|nr:hypothetical protein [Candidatus Peribacteraceae bacterium]